MTAQAKLVEKDRPLSRAQLAALFSDQLFHQNRDDLLFKAIGSEFGRPHSLEIWFTKFQENLVAHQISHAVIGKAPPEATATE
jgi:hypothetical protein